MDQRESTNAPFNIEVAPFGPGQVTCTQGGQALVIQGTTWKLYCSPAPMGIKEPPTTCGLPLFSMAKSSPLSVLVKLQHPEIAGFLLRTHKTLYRHQAHPFKEQIFAVFTAYPCDSVCFITSGAHCSKSAGASEVSSNHRTQPL